MAAQLPDPIIYNPANHSQLLPQCSTIHRACVKHDGMLATILDIDNETKVNAYWQRQHEEVIAGNRVIILQLTDENERKGEVAGIVMLSMPWSETGPFRSIVEKLMVSPSHRQKGIARRLMEKLEDVAREKERGLLLLDTTIGSDAEHVYPRLGYKPIGIVPRYGISPRDGNLADELFFYKDLRDVQNWRCQEIFTGI